MGIIQRKKSILLNEPHIVTVQSGNTTDSAQIAHFRTDMNAPMKSLKVKFAPVQSGSGDPSPTNVRPITGWTGVTVKRAGVNLLQCDTFANGSNASVVFTGSRNSDGEIESIKVSGTGTKANQFRNLNYTQDVNKLLNGRFAFNAYSNQANIQPVSNVHIYAEDGTNMLTHAYSGWYIYNINISNYSQTWARIQTFPYDDTNVSFDTTVYPMMCLASDMGCNFEPYKGTEIPVSWQSEYGTVYGGYVDLVSGELVQIYKSVTLDSLSWNYLGDYAHFRMKTNNTPSDMKKKGMIISNKYKTINSIVSAISYNTAPDLSINQFAPSDQMRIAIKDTRYTDVTSFINDMGDTQIVYELATPLTYQLTPQQIKTLIGQNNIWSDAGDVEVQYWKH